MAGGRVLRAAFHLRCKSLLRGNVVVLGSLCVALMLSHPPEIHATLWLTLPVLAAVAGSVDTARCMQPRWGLYHGGVLLSLYMDLMALMFMLFLLVYPYCYPISGAH